MEAASLRIELSTDGPEHVVRVSGELTYESAPWLDDRLCSVQDAAHPHLVLDMTGVEFCDSVGLSVLIGAYRRAVRHQGTVTLRGLHGSPRRMLSITGVNPLFTIEPGCERVDLLEAAGDRHGEPA
jgi:anti-sigma B factor antagonist